MTVVENVEAPSERAAACSKTELLEHYLTVRRFSEELCRTLEPEDYVIQTMPEMSPTKWHLAHTSWFFETFIIKPYLRDYRPLHPQYAFLFNSYYNAVGKMHARPQRGLISRPTVKDTYAYRQHVDAAMEKILETADGGLLKMLTPLIVLGLNHEQQHQELMLTDLKHMFWMNPLRPAFRTEVSAAQHPTPSSGWRRYDEGLYSIGFEGDGFSFDNETPRHQVFLAAFSLGNQLVTNREFLAFIEDKGYRRPELWLSLGWTAVNERGWNAPLYWEQLDGTWWMMTLAGMRPVRWDEPVCHLSYFEADAYARWAGARLPTEAEWEVAANNAPIEGQFAESGRFHPSPPPQSAASDCLKQMFGELWQWTQSSYAPYPGYQPQPGALGEYNGKFMCNQYVLRGASCATPHSHVRRTYRNFFPPDARWQFMGLRLAKDIA
ncbi:MAG: ergothioneine biosynthesis protein EgtB [Verrucomicrobia bacterium]|nr:MAG: ergothioneine biosynthesis protein EgtB [Verrucomicrobiota bacterium]